MQNRVGRLVLPLLLVLPCAGLLRAAETRTIDLRPLWDTERVLKNPGKGWYHHLLDNGVDRYAIRDEAVFRSFPGMDHLYLRLAWSYLEPREGDFDWRRIDDVVQKYVPLGYGIAFRITSKETGVAPGVVAQERDGVQYATPVWVEDAGARGIVSEAWGVRSWTPDWDDPVYLAKLDGFVEAFAARYDGKPWVRYVDVGSVGEWGEGHTSFSTKVPPTVAEVKASIDIYARHFKSSQLVVTDDLLYYGKPEAEVAALFDYAVGKGMTLRDDSPLVDWYMRNHLETWTVSHPHFYDPLYLRKPIVFELEHYAAVKRNGNWRGRNGAETLPDYGVSGADVMRKALELLHASYIGFHGFPEDWLADNPHLTRELANRCGYWYFPESLSVPRAVSAGQTAVRITWLNRGVAPAYEPFEISLRLVSVDGRVVDLGTHDSGNLGWRPDEPVEQLYRVEVPPSAEAGEYRLQVRLSGDDRAVAIGLKAEATGSDGFSALGSVLVE
jgi:hypothetical protein